MSTHSGYGSVYESSAAEKAEMSLMRAFRFFASKISLDEVDAYFDPRNRSNWQKDFAAYLVQQNQEASND